MGKYKTSWASGRFATTALIAIALSGLTILWLVRTDASSEVERSVQATELRIINQPKVDPVVDRLEREKQEHKAEIRSLRKVHAAEVTKLHAALNAVREQLNSQTVSRVDQTAPKTCQKVAAGGSGQSSAYSVCSAERARLLIKLQRCEIAQLVRGNAIRAKRISAVTKSCGLSKKMILELNR